MTPLGLRPEDSFPRSGCTGYTPELTQTTSQEAYFLSTRLSSFEDKGPTVRYNLLCLSEDDLSLLGPSTATRDQSGLSSHSALLKTFPGLENVYTL